MVTHVAVARDAIWPVPYCTVLYSVCVYIKIGWKWKRKRAQRPIRSIHWLTDWSQYLPLLSRHNGMCTASVYTAHTRSRLSNQIFANVAAATGLPVWLCKYHHISSYENTYVRDTTYLIWYICLKPKWLSRNSENRALRPASNINHSLDIDVFDLPVYDLRGRMKVF